MSSSSVIRNREMNLGEGPDNVDQVLRAKEERLTLGGGEKSKVNTKPRLALGDIRNVSNRHSSTSSSKDEKSTPKPRLSLKKETSGRLTSRTPLGLRTNLNNQNIPSSSKKGPKSAELPPQTTQAKPDTKSSNPKVIAEEDEDEIETMHIVKEPEDTYDDYWGPVEDRLSSIPTVTLNNFLIPQELRSLPNEFFASPEDIDIDDMMKKLEEMGLFDPVSDSGSD